MDKAQGDTLRKDIEDRFENSTLTLQEIADDLGSNYKFVWQHVAKTYSPEARLRRKQQNYRASKLGEQNPQFGKKYDGHYEHLYVGASGYVVVRKPEWYTGRVNKTDVFEHTVVVCEALGLTEIPPGFVVHHIDRNRSNNDLSNLSLMTRAAHTRLHQLERLETRAKPVGSSCSRSAEQPLRDPFLEAAD